MLFSVPVDKGTDPETYELIQRIQLMQKRILGLAAACEERNEQLNEAKKLNEALQKMMEQLPGPDAAVQIYESQVALREQERKTKALEAELTMYETKASEYKFNLERANEELHYVRKTVIEKKKSERIKKERQRKSPNASQSAPLPSKKTHFMGGGFNTTVALKS
ncbi:cilia- and flagella-associated protein 58-like [Hetaerina americana]|uniref:cilia- and flagella-associated protein 58-like n=1 Tax=Hetaerina americana TaxID=62018 RepID=UPI003A7F547F